MELQQRTEWIRRVLNKLATFNSTPGKGVTRFPFTPEAKAASDYLTELMTEAGLTVRMDNSGSVIGRLEGAVPETVMIGSHLDSVQNGGAYDGIAGVVTALAAVKELREQGFQSHYSLEVIATNDEEGSRFRAGLFTGKVLLGQMSVKDIKWLKDKDGITVYEAMKAYGLRPEEIAVHKRTDLKAFLEIHIEQGPILEAKGMDIGVVDLIVGIKRPLVTILGRGDHVGTMPMDMRKDALEMASKVIARIGDRARQFPLAVATVGNIIVEPNIMNIVPNKVTFTVDIRGTTEDIIRQQFEGLEADLQEVTGKYGGTYTNELMLYEKPVDMNPVFKEMIEESATRHGFTHMRLVSGAGHDAQVFGAQMPAAMIFVPSIGGRSHCQEEKTDEGTLAEAAVVAADLLKGISERKEL